ncbi:MAG: four helix bundle protein [Phycisphaerae bacterium]
MTKRPFDLTERTARFGEEVVRFAKVVPVTQVTRSLVDQLVRSGTSIGANYFEADEADTKRDFRFKIGPCRREAKETMHWLRMIAAANPELGDSARPLWQEAKELVLIFNAIRNRNNQQG